MDRPLIRVGYVEDDPDIRAVAELALSDIGSLEIAVFESGDAAVAGLPSAKPDLILLDVMMPGMDGETTLKKLRELPETSETPVIFMTAKSQRHDVERYRSIGAVDVIAKPFDPMTLADDLRAIWQDL